MGVWGGRRCRQRGPEPAPRARLCCVASRHQAPLLCQVPLLLRAAPPAAPSPPPLRAGRATVSDAGGEAETLRLLCAALMLAAGRGLLSCAASCDRTSSAPCSLARRWLGRRAMLRQARGSAASAVRTRPPHRCAAPPGPVAQAVAVPVVRESRGRWCCCNVDPALAGVCVRRARPRAAFRSPSCGAHGIEAALGAFRRAGKSTVPAPSKPVDSLHVPQRPGRTGPAAATARKSLWRRRGSVGDVAMPCDGRGSATPQDDPVRERLRPAAAAAGVRPVPTGRPRTSAAAREMRCRSAADGAARVCSGPSCCIDRGSTERPLARQSRFASIQIGSRRGTRQLSPSGARDALCAPLCHLAPRGKEVTLTGAACLVLRASLTLGGVRQASTACGDTLRQAGQLRRSSSPTAQRRAARCQRRRGQGGGRGPHAGAVRPSQTRQPSLALRPRQPDTVPHEKAGARAVWPASCSGRAPAPQDKQRARAPYE